MSVELGGLFSEETQEIVATPVVTVQPKPIMSLVEQTENESHQAESSAEEFAYTVANRCVKHNEIVLVAIGEMLKNKVCSPNFKLGIGGSLFNTYMANPMDAMVSRALKVAFGSSEQMIRGNTIHLGREIALKHKIKTGKLLPRKECLREMKIFIREKWKYLKPKKEESASLYETFRTACYAFKLYYKELEHDECIEVEETYKVDFPEGAFSNPMHSRNFYGSGTFDGLIKRKIDGKDVYVMVDTKSTSQPISGSVKREPTHEKFLDTLSGLEEIQAKQEKIVKKLSNAQEKLDEAMSTLKDVEAQIPEAKANGKATAALEKREGKWTEEVQKCKENLNIFLQAKKELNIIESEISEMKVVLEPLEKAYKEAKNKADLDECKKEHSEQLAYYSFLEFLKTGRRVDFLRIENTVCKKVKIGGKSYNKPEYQVFEWELEDEMLLEMQESLFAVIRSIELVMDGIVDPLVVWRHNKSTYYGSDLDELIDQIKEMVKIQKEMNKN